MAIADFFKKMLDGTERGAPPPGGARPIPDDLSEVAVAASGFSTRLKHDPQVVLQREEMLDAHLNISGYRFRPACLNSSSLPTSRATMQALKLEKLGEFIQRRMAVIPVTVEDWRNEDFRQFISANTVFMVNTPANEDDIAAWQDGLEEIKVSGARIALDGLVLSVQSPPPAAFLSLADCLFVKFSDYSLEDFDHLVETLRGQYPELILVAEDVLSWPDYRLCISIGIEYCLGAFSRLPDEDDSSESLTPRRQILIKMLNLLRRGAEAEELASVAKRDPGVIVKIVEMANSPLNGLSKPIANLPQAMTMLGREPLYRWITGAIFRAGTNPAKDRTLLEIALCRARFLELLAVGRRSRTECDELFLVGLLSFVDSLLAMPMEEVLKEIHLPASVAEALLKGEGPYGEYLMLALAVEGKHADMLVKHAETLALDAETLAVSQAGALLWAQDALRVS